MATAVVLPTPTAADPSGSGGVSPDRAAELEVNRTAAAARAYGNSAGVVQQQQQEGQETILSVAAMLAWICMLYGA